MPVFHRVFLIVIMLWLLVAPVMWWNHLLNRFGVAIPWQFMSHLAALGIVGLVASPFLWRRNRSAAWWTLAAVVAIGMAQWALPSAMPDGLLVNGALLCAVAALTLRMARQDAR